VSLVDSVRFALLGTMTVVDGAGELVAVSGGRQRALLASLLLSANLPVSSDALAEAVWDGSPPAAAAASLRSHIRRLRSALGAEAGARIVACEPGYRMAASEAELDVLGFEAACRDAGAARRSARWPEVWAAAARALRLWRGTPLLDVPSQVLSDQFVPRLEQLRLQVLEDHAEAGLRLGRHERLIPELRDLTVEHPMREQFHGQLIEALARAGRRAEALDAYRQARRVLVDELGIEPGPHLQLLHRQVLDGDSALATPLAARQDTPATELLTDSASPPAVVPRQLPGAVPHFVGRASELKALFELLPQEAGAGGAVVISAIGGTAGIGKTALAVHWAHEHADRFPDGQLYVNLRGFDPVGMPMPPAEAVRRFLSALGVPVERIPADPDEQAALYRTQLADRRMLILLDNARDAEQVWPLLPGSPGCLVVVTSRDQLAELAALNGAIPLTLGLLTYPEARDLLARRLGAERLATEEQSADDLIQACARLPLALNIVAAQAALNPARPLSELVDQLGDARVRLDALTIGNGAADVRAVFSWSYRTLAPEVAQLFRLLGLHPGPDLSLEAAASLGAIDSDHARRALQALTRAHLLTEHVPGRYSFHDLLRAYAAEQACVPGGESAGHEAVGRLLDHYLHTACAAAALLNPQHEVIAPPSARPGATPENLASREQAQAWFEAEHDVLIAAISLADEAGFDSHASQLPQAMANFLDWRGHLDEWAATQRTALDAATRLGDAAAQAVACRHLGQACARLGDYEQAQAHLAECAGLYRRLGDQDGEARVHQTLSYLYGHLQGNYRISLGHAERAAALFRASGNQAWEASALNNAGYARVMLGDARQGRVNCQQALAIHEKLCNLNGQANDWQSLGWAEYHLGNLAQASDCYRRAFKIYRDLGRRDLAAGTLADLGDARNAAGDSEGARQAWQQALDIFDDLHHKDADRVRARLRQLSQDGTSPTA
jgi:DNA-binding SARP family transcriptional activator